MQTSTITTIAAAILVGAALALVVPAAAQSDPGDAPDQAGSPMKAAHRAQIVLHRDGDKAVPFDPVIGAGAELVLRRDGSKAVPFVAETGSQASPSSSGFDWGGAVMVGGSAVGLMLLGAGALVLVRRSRPVVQPGMNSDLHKG
jgi:hypothetical protein